MDFFFFNIQGKYYYKMQQLADPNEMERRQKKEEGSLTFYEY